METRLIIENGNVRRAFPDKEASTSDSNKELDSDSIEVDFTTSLSHSQTADCTKNKT